MKKLVQKIMAGLAILLVSMGLVSSQLASAAEHSDVVTAVTITDTAGNPITEVGQFQTFRINADFALPDGQIKAGDTTVISLPDSIILSSGTAFEVKDSSGNVVANATVDSATKKVTLVYTDYPSTHSDVKGSIFFEVQIDSKVVTEPKTVDLTINVSGVPVSPTDGPIDYIGPTGPSKDYIEKSGWQSDADPTVLGYAIALNRNGQNFTDLVISDSLQNTAVKILPETFKIEFVDWYYDGSNWQYRNAKNVTANYTVTFTDTSFSVNLGDIPATQGVRIRYDVKADYVPSSGEVFINKVNLKSKENPGREVEEKTTYRSAGGQAEGYVYGIQIKKVDEKGAPLANAHFDIIREANGEVVDQVTTDENGYATIGQLLRGDYILRETQAPDGYELLDTDVRVSGTEFSQSNQTVVKEIVNKLKPEEPTPTPFSIPVKLRAEKVLEGKELAGNDFSFELLQDGQVLDTKQNDASGKVTFDELVFTEEGTFVYELREVNDSQENIVYDETVVTATVTVTRIKDGALAKIEYSTGAVGEKRVLSATATIVGGAGGLTSGVGHSSEIPAAASFVNQYVDPTTTTEEPTTTTEEPTTTTEEPTTTTEEPTTTTEEPTTTTEEPTTTTEEPTTTTEEPTTTTEESTTTEEPTTTTEEPTPPTEEPTTTTEEPTPPTEEPTPPTEEPTTTTEEPTTTTEEPTPPTEEPTTTTEEPTTTTEEPTPPTEEPTTTTEEPTPPTEEPTTTTEEPTTTTEEPTTTTEEPLITEETTSSDSKKQQILPNTGQNNQSLIVIMGFVLFIITGVTGKLVLANKKQ